MDPIEVIAPDGTIIEFPAGTPDDVIARVMREEYGGPDEAAVYEMPGMSEATAIDLRQEGYDPTALAKGMWVIGVEGVPYQLPSDPEIGGPMRPGDQTLIPGVRQRPQRPFEDVIKGFGTGAIQGVTGLVGLPGTVREALGQQAGTGFFNPPSARQLDLLKEGLTGDYYQPQTTAGEYARTVGEFLPGAVVPGGLATKAASVLVPAVASETAGQVTEGTPLETPARITAGILGSLGVGGVQALRSGGDEVLRRAAQNVSPQQLATAEALRARSPIPLTAAEAIQQVTGGSTNLGRVQRVVEQTTTELGPMMAQRPQAVRQAVGNVAAQIAPETSPQQVAGQSQQAAEGVLTRMRQRVNENAQPFYDRLPGQSLPPEQYTQLAENPSYARALEAVRSDPELSALLTGGPEDLSTVNRVVQQLDQMEGAATPGQFNPLGNQTIATQRSRAADLARALASEASPDFAMARVTGATGREAFVDPLKRGPLGTIAGQRELRPALNQQLDALFPQRMNEGQAAETVQALRLMGEIDPNAPAPLVRQYLATQANQSLRDIQGGPNQFGGASLAARLAGTPESERALLGSVEAVAPMASRDVRDLVEALRATGQRMRPGSDTAFNQEIIADMGGGGLVGEGIRAVTTPTSIPGRVNTAVTDFLAERNARQLAQALIAEPQESTRRIQRALRSRRGGNRIRMSVAAMQNGEE